MTQGQDFSRPEDGLMNVGDIVRLKSGGPVMTVDSVAQGTARCVWMKDETPMKHRFSIAALEAAKPTDPFATVA